MKRKRTLTQILLYFTILMFLIVAGCSDSDNDDNNDVQEQQKIMVNVSGKVTDRAGHPISGVIISAMMRVETLNMNIWEGSIDSDQFSFIMTKEDGTYSVPVIAGLVEKYTLILTPAKTGYTFTPTRKALTIGAQDHTGVDFIAAQTSQFSSNDLVGTWRVNMLRTGASQQWMRARMTVAPSGKATCQEYENSAGINVCPDPFELQLTVNDRGVVTQTGNHATASHMTMSSNKKFMAGTGGTRNYQLTIAQKEPKNLAGYTANDAYEKDFVFHSLNVGTVNEWRYGSGYTDDTGLIAQEVGSELSSGTVGETLAGQTLVVEPDTGVVTIQENPNFKGFLSADEKTIVGTTFVEPTEEGAVGTYTLMVIQINAIGQAATFTGSSVNHLLAVNDETSAWAYHDVNVSRLETTVLPDILKLTFAVNLMFSYNWEFSGNLGYTTNMEKLLYTDIEKLNIDPTGQATIIDPGTKAIVFHGQLAYDGGFMVGTETMQLNVNDTATDFHTLNVITR